MPWTQYEQLALSLGPGPAGKENVEDLRRGFIGLDAATEEERDALIDDYLGNWGPTKENESLYENKTPVECALHGLTASLKCEEGLENARAIIHELIFGGDSPSICTALECGNLMSLKQKELCDTYGTEELCSECTCKCHDEEEEVDTTACFTCYGVNCVICGGGCLCLDNGIISQWSP